MIRELRAKHEQGERIPELHIRRNDFGVTPLQAALDEADVPAGVINALLDAHTVRDEPPHALVDPNDTSVRDWYVPLLRACQNIRDDECIRRIIDHDPSAILKKEYDPNHSEWSVFHVILQKQPSLALADYMAQVWAEQKGIDIDNACNDIVRDRDAYGMLPIHYAIQEHAPTNVTLRLLEKYPDSAAESIDGTRTGLSTLHMAVFHGCSFEVLKELCEQAPGKISDNRAVCRKTKDTPLHLLFHVDNKSRWLRDQAPPGIMPSYKMAWYLIQKFAKHLKSMGAKRKAGPKVQAMNLVDKIKDEGNYTVFERLLDMDEELEKYHNSRDYEEFTKLKEEIQRSVLGGLAFPQINFEE